MKNVNVSENEINNLLKKSNLNDRDIERICDILEDSMLGPALANRLDSGELDEFTLNKIKDKQIERIGAISEHAEKLYYTLDSIDHFTKQAELFKEKKAILEKQQRIDSFKNFFCCGFGRKSTNTPSAYASIDESDEENNTNQGCCTLQ